MNGAAETPYVTKTPKHQNTKKLSLHSFLFQQRPLPFDPPAIAAEPAIGGDDPVAGHDHGGRIGAAGPGDGAGAAGQADLAREFAVGDGSAGGNLLKCSPYLALEDGAAQVQRQRFGRFAAVVDQSDDRIEYRSEIPVPAAAQGMGC